MIFFFKPSTIQLDCFTHRPDVYRFFPIVKGNKCFPNWWKNLKNPYFDFETMKIKANMKSCSGFLDFYMNSICIKFWSDLAIEMKNTNDIEFKWQFGDFQTQLQTHTNDQFPNYLDGGEHIQIKFWSPWLFKCKKDINWVWVGNSWEENFNNEMNIPPGVLNFKHQHATHVQLFLKCEKNKVTRKFFKSNTPLVNIFPMSEKKIIVHNHLIDQGEYKKMQSSQVSALGFFTKKYFQGLKLTKEKESKCPFGFK